MEEEKTMVVHALIHQVIFGIKVLKRHRKLETKSPRIAIILADTWARDARLKSREQITVWID